MEVHDVKEAIRGRRTEKTTSKSSSKVRGGCIVAVAAGLVLYGWCGRCFVAVAGGPIEPDCVQDPADKFHRLYVGFRSSGRL